MRALVVLAATLLVACAHPVDLEPAPGARRVQGRPAAAVSAASGVVVVADAADFPSRVPIERVVTPVRVRLENRSDVPIRVRYGDFALETPDGRRYTAIPPRMVTGEVTVSADVVHDHWHEGIRPYPWYSGTWGLAPSPFGGYSPYPYDPFWFDDSAVTYTTVELPTGRMLAYGLQEGTLAPGGVVEGWLYFRELPSDVDAVTFTASVVEARTNRPLGEVEIPFVAG